MFEGNSPGSTCVKSSMDFWDFTSGARPARPRWRFQSKFSVIKARAAELHSRNFGQPRFPTHDYFKRSNANKSLSSGPRQRIAAGGFVFWGTRRNDEFFASSPRK